MKFNYILILTGSSKLLYVNKSKNDDLDLLLFDFATILAANNNFSLRNKIAEGDFGHVYKVTMLTTTLFFFSKKISHLQSSIYAGTLTKFWNI